MIELCIKNGGGKRTEKHFAFVKAATKQEHFSLKILQLKLKYIPNVEIGAMAVGRLQHAH